MTKKKASDCGIGIPCHEVGFWFVFCLWSKTLKAKKESLGSEKRSRQNNVKEKENRVEVSLRCSRPCWHNRPAKMLLIIR